MQTRGQRLPKFKNYLSSRFTTHRRPTLHHCRRRFQADGIAEDRSDRQRLAVEFIFEKTIVRRDLTVDNDLVPCLGMADIVDRNIVVLAPGERYGLERLALAQHVTRGRLPLA